MKLQPTGSRGEMDFFASVESSDSYGSYDGYVAVSPAAAAAAAADMTMYVEGSSSRHPQRQQQPLLPSSSTVRNFGKQMGTFFSSSMKTLQEKSAPALANGGKLLREGMSQAHALGKEFAAAVSAELELDGSPADAADEGPAGTTSSGVAKASWAPTAIPIPTADADGSGGQDSADRLTQSGAEDEEERKNLEAAQMHETHDIIDGYFEGVSDTRTPLRTFTTPS